MRTPTRQRPWAAAGLAAAVAAPVMGQTTRPAVSDHVKVSQVGYTPAEAKRAMLTGDARELSLRTASGKVVRTLPAGEAHFDADSGDTIRVIDFSSIREPGEYVLDAAGLGASYPFRIAADIYARPLRLAMRSFYGQRCGTSVDLAPDFPQYRYDACHLHASFHESSGKTGPADIAGGWHDAGDFGRYIVNSGITCGTLLWAYELNEPALKPLKLDIPESGGPLPDYLAEVKWNLDWMLKMQDADGGVWHKASSTNFCGFVMPKDDPLPAFVIGSGKAPYKTTPATADFAAVCAIAARVYRPFDAAYADRCLAASKNAWQWVSKTPDTCFTDNPPGVVTGGYGDDKPGDEKLWAAAELFRTTGEATYHDYVRAHYRDYTITDTNPPGWPNVEVLALFAYAMSEHADVEAVKKITADAVAACDKIVARASTNGYRIPLTSEQYIWGSNSVAANYAIVLRLTDRLAPHDEYKAAAQDVLHYFLGRNTFNTSFVTHVGSKWPMRPHHRPSAADGIDQPWPGLIVGGPNSHQGKAPKGTPVARVWNDDQNDYVTNETAINWNAPLVFLLAEASKQEK